MGLIDNDGKHPAPFVCQEVFRRGLAVGRVVRHHASSGGHTSPNLLPFGTYKSGISYQR